MPEEDKLNDIMKYTLENEGDKEASKKDLDECPYCNLIFKKGIYKNCPRCGMCLGNCD